jgi:hypothetical protein
LQTHTRRCGHVNSQQQQAGGIVPVYPFGNTQMVTVLAMLPQQRLTVCLVGSGTAAAAAD